MKWRINLLAAMLALATASLSLAQTPVGTAFTYQGQLKLNGVPVHDTFGFLFTLNNADVGGTEIGWVEIPALSVANGLFTATLDFGEGAFCGDARWLEVRVRAPGSENYVQLSPRQELTPVPYALALPGLRTESHSTCPNVVGGAVENYVSPGAYGATIAGGGSVNRVTDQYGTVGGGSDNQAGDGAGPPYRSGATVGGGNSNSASGTCSTVGGGFSNAASGAYSIIGGGDYNTASGSGSIVGGGEYNAASGALSTIGGGGNNVASGFASMVLGGQGNLAGGYYSLAAGVSARVRDPSGSGDDDGDEGTFVWADTTQALFESTGPDQFLIRASGGVGINTNTPQAALHVGGTSGVDGIMFPDGTLQTTAASGLGGSGTTDFLAKFTGGTTLGDSVIYESAGNVGIGTTTPGEPLSVAGAIESTSNGFKFPDGTIQTTAATAAEPAWGLTGNAGTDPATDFIGTTDYQALEVKVDNTRILRFEPNSFGSNIIGGCPFNSANTGVHGATISGGGYYDGSSDGANRVTDEWGTVGGGLKNVAGDSAGSTDDAARATVGGGFSNTASGPAATVDGGYGNTASGAAAAVGGGDANWAAGGNATIGGGTSNTASGALATVGGGFVNTASGPYATIGGGYTNSASGDRATVGGGVSNTASYTGATVGGGSANDASSGAATIGGGSSNTASGYCATVGGGSENAASGNDAIVGGGHNNWASGSCTTIGGGNGNTASGIYSTVAGGFQNVAGGRYSFAAGQYAHVRTYGEVGGFGDEGTFMWADASPLAFVSTGCNRFMVRASGGTYIYSNTALSSGVTLAAGASAWSSVSDRAAKENFAAVEGRELLDKLADVPVQTWNYKSQDPSIHHIGPMAQDFHAAFGVGEDDKTISTIDADGVALAGVQALYQLTRDQDAEIARQDAEIALLKEQNARLEAAVAKLVAESERKTERPTQSRGEQQ